MFFVREFLQKVDSAAGGQGFLARCLVDWAYRITGAAFCTEAVSHWSLDKLIDNKWNQGQG